MSPCTRARQYVAKIPPAVSGQHGHAQTFSVAVSLLHGFALPVHEAWPILSDYSARCDPPWSEKELRHKIQSAAALGSHTKPRGHLLAGGTARRVWNTSQSVPKPAVQFIGQIKPPEKPSAVPPPEEIEVTQPVSSFTSRRNELTSEPPGSVATTSSPRPQAQGPRPFPSASRVPAGLCPVCWHKWARALMEGHCICTGDVVHGKRLFLGMTGNACARKHGPHFYEASAKIECAKLLTMRLATCRRKE